MKIIWRRKSLVASSAGAAIVLALALAGCSGLNVGSLPGSTPGTPGAASGGDAHGAGGCAPSGTSIPKGHYHGAIAATITTAMTITAGGISIPNAGSGTESWKGTVDLVSTGSAVTGTITLSELGLSQVGASGGVQVHSVDTSDLKGTISGPASAPTVAAQMSGEWASLDAPVANGSGDSTSNGKAGLHITNAGCNSISGNAVAMFADLAAPVAQYIAVSGSGAWTATRK
jgi:hypothetical protein